MPSSSKNKTKKNKAQQTKQTSDHSIEVTATEVEEQQSLDSATEQVSEESAPIRVEFPYSDVVRSYVPDAMAIADKALGDWKTEGSFMNLGIENPYANMAVSLGLQNAKKIEKKLEEKGVLPVVRMGFEVLKSKVTKHK